MADTARGLVLINTGEGKGKTTAALGTALRAVGDGLKVLIIQFIKGGWTYGELKSIELLKEATGRIDIKQLGKGFVFYKQDESEEKKAEHQAAAKAAWAEAVDAVMSGDWDLVIMDELNYAVGFGLVSVDDVVKLIKEKPAPLHLIMTGRGAKDEVIELADTVTEMKCVKHAYQKGIKAVKGIEF